MVEAKTWTANHWSSWLKGSFNITCYLSHCFVGLLALGMSQQGTNFGGRKPSLTMSARLHHFALAGLPAGLSTADSCMGWGPGFPGPGSDFWALPLFPAIMRWATPFPRLKFHPLTPLMMHLGGPWARGLKDQRHTGKTNTPSPPHKPVLIRHTPHRFLRRWFGEALGRK